MFVNAVDTSGDSGSGAALSTGVGGLYVLQEPGDGGCGRGALSTRHPAFLRHRGGL